VSDGRFGGAALVTDRPEILCRSKVGTYLEIFE
jgi:hypothetical protein